MCSRNPPGLCTQSHTVLVMVYNWPSVARLCAGNPDHLLPETCYLKSAAKHNTTNQLYHHKPCSCQITVFEKQIEGVKEQGNRNNVNCKRGIVICVCAHMCTEQSEPGWVYSQWTPYWDRGLGLSYSDIQFDPFIRSWEQTCGHHTSGDLQEKRNVFLTFFFLSYKKDIFGRMS